MFTQILKSLGITGVLGTCLLCRVDAPAQAPAQPPPGSPAGGDALPPVPRGVEVMARGPVHEAFATPTAEARETHTIPKKPPAALEEMPPEDRPEGNVVWIGGYWAWDDDRTDFLWVSGCWRAKPPGREWVPGYWRERGEQWQWVAGFWTEAAVATAAAAQEDKGKDITYYPAPPAPPQITPPGERPNPDSFYVPGQWVWNVGRYAWRPGYWARVQPGYMWVPAHYRWTPYGYVYIAGYWDLAVARRGILYAPVVVDYAVVGPTFVYTPAYAVSDTIVLDTMFVRPACCHYYFGDYYGDRYRDLGYESCVVYSRSHYDSIVVYRTWEYRDNPRWVDIQINLYSDRYYGRAPVPPRTLVQQNTVINNVNNTTIVNNNVNNTNVLNNVNNASRTTNNMQVLAPTSKVAAAQGMKTAPMDPGVRQQAALQAKTVQQAASAQRRQAETPVAGSVAPTAPRTASLRVPPSQTVPARPMAGMTAAPGPKTAAGATSPAALQRPQVGNAQIPRAGQAAGKPAATAQPSQAAGQRTPYPTAAAPGAKAATPYPAAKGPAQGGTVPGAGARPGQPQPRPAATAAPRPQPRPAPPRRSDDEKKKKN